jgi:hypothetical protein
LATGTTFAIHAKQKQIITKKFAFEESRRKGTFYLQQQRRKSNSICHILSRNCLLKHVIGGRIEGRIEVTGIRGRRRKQLVDDLKETGGYWNWKEGELDGCLDRVRSGAHLGR